MFKRKEINGSPLNFRLPKELKAKIRGVAVEHKITLSDVIREILNEYFKCHHSSNQKIIKEREDAAKRRDKNNSSPNGETVALQSSSSSSTKPSKIKTRASPFVPPDWIDPDVWKAFIEHRQKLRAPMTDKAKALMVNKVFKLNGEPNDILNQSIENGWKGVFEIKENNNGSIGQGQNTGFDNRSRAKKVSDKLDEIARRDIEQNGFTSELG